MKIQWSAILGFTGACLFASLASAQVCQFTNSTLLGPYAFVANQFASVPINPPGTTGALSYAPFSNTTLGAFLSGINKGNQFSNIGVLTFDGSGNITAISASVLGSNSTPQLNTGSSAQVGTYVVRGDDCSVTITLTDPFVSLTSPPSTTFAGAILGNGNEIDINSFVTSTGGTSTTTSISNPTGPSAKFIRVQNRSFCSAASLQGLYGFVINTSTLSTTTSNASGATASTVLLNPATVVGYVVFDGVGSIKANPVSPATGTTSSATNVNTAQRALQFSGTYTVNPDCSGSMTISNASSLSSNGPSTGGPTVTPQSLIVNFVELGAASSGLSSFSQPSQLALSVSSANTLGVGYAIAQ
jgi:hypothetical protein